MASNLCDGLEEISFFSKNIDYDKELYESHFLKKVYPEYDGSINHNPEEAKKHNDLLKIWEQGGPVKVLTLPDFDFEVYPLYFRNFQELDYYQLKELLGNFFTLCEFENLKVRVTYKTEKDLRVGYQILKKDQRYDLKLFLDSRDYHERQKNNSNKNHFNSPKNKTGLKLINQWLNKGDVVIETNKNNCYPIQIKNYKEFNYDELVELFSKYGKFTSIAQLDNEYVQVKFCSEEAARKCIVDLKKDRRFNVRLLFFLKELNANKKIVKDIVSSKLDDHVAQLLNAEERIKFNPDQIPFKRESSRLNQKNKKQEDKNTKNKEIKNNIVYHKQNFENGNIYIKGIPLENPFLIPPHSYKVWKNKQNHLPPPPPPDDSENSGNDANYKYYLKSMKVLGYYSHSSCCGDR